jgi:hypothetical protein
MSRRVKMKSALPKGSGEDIQMLNSMFDQMTGASHADHSIIKPKYEKIKVSLTKFCKVFELLLNFKNFPENFPECKKSFSEIRIFIDKIRLENNLVETETSDKKEKGEDEKKEINEKFVKLKDSAEVQQIIITSSILGKHKKYLEDKANLSDEFIRREPGLSMEPFPFSSFDLKKIWVSDNFNEMIKKFILNILSHLYKLGYEIYDLVTSPNVDIKQFSQVLIRNIGMLKKQIPRCDKAFDIISDSVIMLEGNFKGYYKTSVEAENPSIIIESFIVDVSMKQKSNANITRQFRKIIMFMKKKSANNNDPRVKKLFSILNSQFSLMEKETPGYVRPNDDEPESLPQEPDMDDEAPDMDDEAPDMDDEAPDMDDEAPDMIPSETSSD